MTKIIICEASYSDFDFAFDPFLEDVKQGYLGIGGNRDYDTHFSGLLEKVRKAVDTWGCYDFVDVMNDLDFVPAANRVQLYKLFDRPTCSRCWSYYNDDMKVADIMSFLTGDKWEETTINGSCQGEWQTVIYNTRYCSDAYISELEDVYFGSIVSLGVIEDDSLEVDTYNVEYWDYISYYHDDKESICKKLGLDPENVTLYQKKVIKSISYTYSEV